MTFSFSDLNPPPILEDSSFLFVTVIIPTYNCAQTLSMTLDSIIQQNYPHCEIIVIDSGSTDRTLELLHTYYPEIQLFSAPAYKIYHMLNLGIGLAKGEYVNFLFPGDFHIHSHTIAQMMAFALQMGNPDLVYCATLLRDGISEPKSLFRLLNLKLLEKGQQPTSLQACWFKRDLFKTLGEFRTDFQMRGAFELFCRFCLTKDLRFAATNRSYIDFDLKRVTSAMVICHFYETGQTVHSYFGKWALAKWFMRQKDFKRFVKLWFKKFH